MNDFNPDSLFENFGHIGTGKKMKPPVIESVDHQYQTEVDLYVSGGKDWEPIQTKVTLTWTVRVDSGRSRIKSIEPVIPDQIFSVETEDGIEKIKVSDPEIEIMVGDKDPLRSLALSPYEIEIFPKQRATVRFYGGG